MTNQTIKTNQAIKPNPTNPTIKTIETNPTIKVTQDQWHLQGLFWRAANRAAWDKIRRC